jgi:hypothetical protein
MMRKIQNSLFQSYKDKRYIDTNGSSRFASWLSVITSVSSLIIITLMVLIAGYYTPGYNHIFQHISELGAKDAPYEWNVRFLGFLPSGILLISFCFFAHMALPRSKGTTLGLAGLVIYALGYIVAAVFPCDPGCRPNEPSLSQLIHNVGGFIGYLLAPFFLFALTLAARSWPGAKWLVIFGSTASFFTLICLFTLFPSSPAPGLSQRLLETLVLSWSIFCGIYLVKRAE